MVVDTIANRMFKPLPLWSDAEGKLGRRLNRRGSVVRGDTAYLLPCHGASTAGISAVACWAGTQPSRRPASRISHIARVSLLDVRLKNKSTRGTLSTHAPWNPWKDVALKRLQKKTNRTECEGQSAGPHNDLLFPPIGHVSSGSFYHDTPTAPP